MPSFNSSQVRSKHALDDLPGHFLGDVSIPHRYDQNGTICAGDGLLAEVSIPHRYDQNRFIPDSGYDHRKWVSIPHRYDQNVLTRLKNLGISMRFQFLIGTIKTGNIEIVVFIKISAFQFLIGTIKTCKNDANVEGNVPKFQFLIGTIKTPRAAILSSTCRSVSIPHRYDQNSLLSYNEDLLCEFQFLIGTIKTRA